MGENKEDGGVVIVYRRLLRASESNTELWYTNSTNLHFLSNYQASRKYIKYINIYISIASGKYTKYKNIYIL